MKILFYVLSTLLLCVSLNSCNHDEPERKSNNVSSSNNSSSASNNSSSNVEDGIINSIISNTSYSTSYSDFCFKTVIKTKLTSDINNVSFDISLLHGCPGEEEGCEINGIIDNIELVETRVYLKGAYLYTEFKCPGAIYFAMKAAMASREGLDNSYYLNRMGDFLIFYKERNNYLKELENPNSHYDGWEEETRNRIREIEGFMTEMMREAKYDYCQTYFLVYKNNSHRLGNWTY